MSQRHDPDERFAEDLRSAFPPAELPQDLAEVHVAAMSEAQLVAEHGAPAPASRPLAADGRLRRWRRRTMRGRMLRRVIAVATGLVLSLGGLAIAGAITGGDDPSDDDSAIVVPADDVDDVDEVEDVDEAEEVDDQAEEPEEADDEADENDDADENDEADENNDADDQGEDDADENDEANENDDADDQGEDDDDQGEDDDDSDDADEGDDGED